MNEWYRPWAYSSQWIMNTHLMKQHFSIWSLFRISVCFAKCVWQSFLFFFNRFTEVTFSCPKIRPFWVYNSRIFSKCTELWEQHHNWRTFPSYTFAVTPHCHPLSSSPRKPVTYFHLYRFGQSILTGCKISDIVDNITYLYHKSKKPIKGEWGNKHHGPKWGRCQGLI